MDDTMNKYFSLHTVKTVFDHLPEKLAASADNMPVMPALGIHEKTK